MSPEKEKVLLEKFPNMYRKRFYDKKETCMCWGFCTGDGWFDIIFDLSKKLHKIEPKINKQLKKQKQEDFAVEQVKEKFGTLRFYTNYSDPVVDELIREAERSSAKTCEECGKPGKLRSGGGWLHIHCDDCEKEYKKNL